MAVAEKELSSSQSLCNVRSPAVGIGRRREPAIAIVVDPLPELNRLGYLARTLLVEGMKEFICKSPSGYDEPTIIYVTPLLEAIMRNDEDSFDSSQLFAKGKRPKQLMGMNVIWDASEVKFA